MAEQEIKPKEVATTGPGAVAKVALVQSKYSNINIIFLYVFNFIFFIFYF